MSLQTFIDKYKGKKVAYQGGYVGECVSLVKVYIQETFGFNPPPTGANAAYGYWTNFPAPLGDYFVKVPNTPDGVPKPGDVMIWNKNYGPYGHIAIVTGGDTNSFTAFSQNDPLGTVAGVRNYTYKNIYGWLQPKETMADISLPQDKFEELVSKASKFDAFVNAGFPNPEAVKQLMASYEDTIRALRSERDTASATAEERRKEWNDLIAFLAKELGTRQDVQEIKDVAEDYDQVVSDAERIKDNYNRDKLSWGTAEQEFTAEIARLKALLEQKNVLENASNEDLLKEIVRRLAKIMKLI